jgi:hypothetical protein
MELTIQLLNENEYKIFASELWYSNTNVVINNISKTLKKVMHEYYDSSEVFNNNGFIAVTIDTDNIEMQRLRAEVLNLRGYEKHCKKVEAYLNKN